jgi:hypothetical protein
LFSILNAIPVPQAISITRIAVILRKGFEGRNRIGINFPVAVEVVSYLNNFE